MINAINTAYSIGPHGDRILSVLATFPRIILAEINTHKMLVKNTSSSRAIPFFKMVQMVYDNPFIPIAWQTHHSGMQGTEYIDVNSIITVSQFAEDFADMIYRQAEKDKVKVDDNFIKMIDIMKLSYVNLFESKAAEYTIKDLWLKARDSAATTATMLYTLGGVTKQICNRLIEPFSWTTMLISGNVNDLAWENFFNLRCPKYKYHNDNTGSISYFKSKKDWIYEAENNTSRVREHNRRLEEDPLLWFKINEGKAEIHIMALAELIYDIATNDTPIKLKAGEWHVPFVDKIIPLVKDRYSNVQYEGDAQDIDNDVVKTSTSMAARTSFTVVGQEKEFTIEKHIKLHDDLVDADPLHASPMEHAARCMGDVERGLYQKVYPKILNGEANNFFVEAQDGWCRHYEGFIPYRHIIETQKQIKLNVS